MKKGQAALEFLMTYGWAILVVLAAIGSITYFGVLSPGKFLPERCVASPPFSCTQYKLSAAANSVNFTLQNSAGVDLRGPIFVTVTCDGTSSANMTGWALANASTVVGNGNTFAATLAGGNLPAGCSALTAGNKFKASYTIVYSKSGETVSHTGSGSIQGRVE